MLIDEALVRALVAEQMPDLAALPVHAVVPGGHDNRTFRLGEDLIVRLPSGPGYAAAVAKEQRWLPHLAAGLPVPVPVPVAAGAPSDRFPFPWSVNRWLAGDVVTAETVPDRSLLAADVADLLLALHRVPSLDGPPPGDHNFSRGGDLHVYAADARAALDRLPDRDEAAWGEGLLRRALASTWRRAPVWVHGDIAVGNLLVRTGRLAAVIDFGGCAVGDPASDLVLAWTFLDAPAARRFADRLDLDEDTWHRAAGWALWKALIATGSKDADARSAGRTLVRLREDLPDR